MRPDLLAIALRLHFQITAIRVFEEPSELEYAPVQSKLGLAPRKVSNPKYAVVSLQPVTGVEDWSGDPEKGKAVEYSSGVYTELNLVLPIREVENLTVGSIISGEFSAL